MVQNEYTVRNGRRVVFEAPRFLVDQIQNRARLNGRKRNAELRYLLNVGLNAAGEADIAINLPGRKETEWVQVSGVIDPNVHCILKDRANLFQRSVGMEIIRTAGFAIEESARRDLALIAEMMSRQGRSQPSAPQTAGT